MNLKSVHFLNALGSPFIANGKEETNSHGSEERQCREDKLKVRPWASKNTVLGVD